MNLNETEVHVESSDLPSHSFLKHSGGKKQWDDDYSVQVTIRCALQILQQPLEDAQTAGELSELIALVGKPGSDYLPAEGP